MILSYFQLYTYSLRVKNNTKLFINKDVIVLGFWDITYDLKSLYLGERLVTHQDRVSLDLHPFILPTYKVIIQLSSTTGVSLIQRHNPLTHFNVPDFSVTRAEHKLSIHLKKFSFHKTFHSLPKLIRAHIFGRANTWTLVRTIQHGFY